MRYFIIKDETFRFSPYVFVYELVNKGRGKNGTSDQWYDLMTSKTTVKVDLNDCRYLFGLDS